MSKQMIELMQKRTELLVKIAEQRGQMTGMGTRLQTPLEIADQGLAAMRFLRSNPVLVAGVAALIVIRRRGVIGLVQSVWRVWKGYRYFTAISAKLSSRL